MLIYTDGSCYPNPGPGGWAFVVYNADGSPRHEAFGSAKHTTNNRMEMLAIVRAMLWADGQACVIHSDSQLCVNTLTTWARAWQRNGWRKREGEIANLDIVRPAFELFQRMPDVTLRWVRGHAGNVGNERADVLCGEARMKAQAQLDAAVALEAPPA
jgi:ribonuclease HI